MTFHREGIGSFLGGLALYGTYFSRPYVRRLRAKWRTWRGMLVRWRLQEVKLRPAPRDAKPLVGEKNLEAAQRVFENLGFEHIGDFWAGFLWPEVVFPSPDTKAPLASPLALPLTSMPELSPQGMTCCRVLVHRGHKCVAHIVAFKQKPKEGAKTLVHYHYAIASNGDGWSYATSTTRLFTLAHLLRLPRSLSTRLPLSVLKKKSPKAPLGFLLKCHLHFRQRIATKANIEWQEPPTLAQAIEWEREEVELLRSFARKCSPPVLGLRLWRTRGKHSIQWKGELHGKL